MAIALSPDDADAFFSRGQAYDAMNDTLNALNDYDNVLQIDSTYDDAYYFRGSDRLKVRDEQGAIEDLTMSLASDSSYYMVYYLRGTAYDSLKLYRSAINDFKASLKLETDDENVYFGLGYSYLKIGDKDRACENLNDAYYYGMRGEAIKLLDENCRGRVKLYWR